MECEPQDDRMVVESNTTEETGKTIVPTVSELPAYESRISNSRTESSVSESNFPLIASSKKEETVSICNSVVIEIEEQEKTVIPASDSGSDTDFEEEVVDKEDNHADKEDGNEVAVTKSAVDSSMIDESSSDGENGSSEEEYGPSDGEESESASQMAQRELLESLAPIEQMNRIELQNLKRFSPSDRIFPDVRSSPFHTVAVTLTDDYKSGDALIPYPSTFISKWHKDYVPMPCCPENQKCVRRRVQAADQNVSAEADQEAPEFEETTIKLWERITTALSAPMHTCEDVCQAVKSYCKFSGDFTVLEYTLDILMSPDEREKFFSTVLPGMVKLCLGLPEILTCPLPFLFRFMNYSITLSQKQVASILANAFFSTFPKRFSYEDDFPSFNFLPLLTGSRDDDRIASRANKLRCILHYFARVVEDMPKGVVTYTRKSVRTSKTPDWAQSQKNLTRLITLHEGTIETDGERLLQIDFANKYVGGGVLGHGCVQEEIFFVIYPELLVSRLFTERLVSCEALVMTGCERFSNYKGYSSSFEFAGDFIDCTPWSARGRKCTQIVAIDALFITRPTEQFHPQKLSREVNKAFIGFSNPPGTSSSVAVATGKWGCGAFRGDAHLKTVIQLLAASQAGRSLVLFTFGDLYLQKEAEEIYAAIKGKTVGEVWALLLQYYKLFCSRQQPSTTLHEFLTQYARSYQPVAVGTVIQEKQSRSPSSKSPGGKSNKSSPRRSGGMNLKQFILSPKRLSQRSSEGQPSDSNSADWLRKLSDSKSGWGSGIKSTSGSLVPESDKRLTDEEICAFLDAEDDSMEVDAPAFSETQSAHQEGEKLPVQSNSETPQCSAVSARTNAIVKEPTASPSSSGIPKQKRQMTLDDFYKPLGS